LKYAWGDFHGSPCERKKNKEFLLLMNYSILGKWIGGVRGNGRNEEYRALGNLTPSRPPPKSKFVL
jgi:hypothetical protein